MSTTESMGEFVGSTGVEVLHPDTPEEALALARDIAESSGRRIDTPVRNLFVRDFSNQGAAPLTVLIGRGGRGGGVAVKLYLALLWRCSAPPYDTAVSARKWAALLGLEDPNHRGARRVTDALRILEDEGLVTVTRQRGEASTITVREESGKAEYTPPYELWNSEASKEKENLYFWVPTTLWTKGHIQSMSAPALAMLLVCLANDIGATGKPLWWSTKIFPEQYGLSPATRARGTRELVGRRLLHVKKQLVSESKKGNSSFSRERVRNLYHLINDAHRVEPDATSKKAKGLTPIALPPPPGTHGTKTK